MTNPRSFLWIWIITLTGLAILVGGINLLVDPYDVFGTVRISGISKIKPAAKNHAMLAKTHQIGRAHPVTVVIGSSSAHIGIDASDREWPAAMQPVYNYGIPGYYSTSASLRTLQEAVTGGGVKNAVVFLDFQNFFSPERPSAEPGEDERRYRTALDGTPNPHRPLQMANDMFLSLATMGALVDSLTTVFSQVRSGALNLSPDGSSNEADFINAARADGMHDIFAQKDEFEVDRAVRLKQILAGWTGPLPNIGIIADIIAYAAANQVGLTLVLAPHHADAFEIYWRYGLWPRVEQIKTELAEVAAAGNVTLWDFMDYSSFTTEGVPPAGDRRSPTSWFWEPTHYKKQLGQLMIQRMFGTGAPPFGVVLTPQNVAARNAAVRAQRQEVVCDGDGDRLLTALEQPIDDGCNQVRRLVVGHGPT